MHALTMDDVYLICFVVGIALSLLTVIGGFGHLHLGRLHIGHSAHLHGKVGLKSPSHGLSAINGFTLTAFLCWFGGAGYLLHHFGAFGAPVVLLFAVISGVAGASLLWALLFKVLLPRERVLTEEDTEMAGVIAHVSDSIREQGGVGEIIYSQTGARRCAAARSEDGGAIERGTEVVVIRYERGVAYVRRWDELSGAN
jgi:membrane protein implicated in regulation of membrane protease activity